MKLRGILVLALSALAISCGTASASTAAHDLDYAVARVVLLEDGRFEIAISFHIAAYVLEAEPGHLSLDDWARLRAMPDRNLRRATALARAHFVRRLTVLVDGQEAHGLSVTFPDEARIRRDGLAMDRERAPPVIIRGRAGSEQLTAAFPHHVGTVLLAVARGDTAVAGQFVAAGQASLPIPFGSLPAGTAEPALPVQSVLLHYVSLGFQHILPGGLDHILFVLGLFLLSASMRPLLWQITAFTVAHSITLVLAALDVVSLPASVVEPLIALSIAVIAAENLVTSRLRVWRPAVVFGFGLLHGLGFAGALRDLQLPGGEMAWALAGFNLGVEGGQICVILLAIVATAWFRSRTWYRIGLVVPASLGIGLVGIVWTFQRVLGVS